MNSLLLLLILVVLVAMGFTLRQILLEMRMQQSDFSKEDAVIKAAKKEVEGAKGRIPQTKEVK